jgi:hypothetical protein
MGKYMYVVIMNLMNRNVSHSTQLCKIDELLVWADIDVRFD